MTNSIHFRASRLHCHCAAPHPIADGAPLHGLHLHGSLAIRLDDAECVIPSHDVCLNAFAAVLAQMRDHVVLGTRKLDPTTYHLHGPPAWPLLEFLRMADNVRVAALFAGEGDSTVVPVAAFQQSVDAFLQEILATVHARGPRDTAVQEQDFFASPCPGFRCARAAQAPPVRLQSAVDPARAVAASAPSVVCTRIADMDATPQAGSLRGQCGRCASPVWISPASRVLIEEQSSPVFCLQCLSP